MTIINTTLDRFVLTIDDSKRYTGSVDFVEEVIHEQQDLIKKYCSKLVDEGFNESDHTFEIGAMPKFKDCTELRIAARLNKNGYVFPQSVFCVIV